MAITDMMLSVLENSGLLPLWNTIAPWLALDERQLIFMIATPVFIAITVWEYLKLRHNPKLMDTRRPSAISPWARDTRSPKRCLPASSPFRSTRSSTTIGCWIWT